MDLHSIDARARGADDYLFGRGPAWFALVMTVGLMIFRLRRSSGHRLAISIPEGRLGTVRQATRRARFGRFRDRGARGNSGGAVRRPGEPGEEHCCDGRDLEPRHDLMHVHAQL